MHNKNVSKVKCKQHIYVFPLRKYHNFKFPEQPYPKKDTETPILSRKWIKKDGILCSEVEVYSDEVLSPIF